MSSTRCAPPHISAQSATVARSTTRPSAGPAQPLTPISASAPPGGSPPRPLLLRGGAPPIGDPRPAGQPGGEDGPGAPAGPPPLHHHGEPHKAAPGPAVLLRIDQTEPSLLGELGPELVGHARR